MCPGGEGTINDRGGTYPSIQDFGERSGTNKTERQNLAKREGSKQWMDGQPVEACKHA